MGKWPSPAPLSFLCLPHPPACSPIVICQYTVIRDVACLIKIAACPEMELPSRTCLIKVLIDKMKKSHPDGCVLASPPPVCPSLLITGDEGERYKGPQEMLLRNNQYVLLCDVTGQLQLSRLNHSRSHRSSTVGMAPCSRLAECGVGGLLFCPNWSLLRGWWPQAGLASFTAAHSEQCIAKFQSA